VNTDRYGHPGQHWCAIYSNGYGQVECFDSYGRSPARNSIDIARWIHKRANTVLINPHQLQGNQSSVCGHYCLLYLRQRQCGVTLHAYVESFDHFNLEANDAYVVDVISSMYSDCLPNNCIYNQTCNQLMSNM